MATNLYQVEHPEPGVTLYAQQPQKPKTGSYQTRISAIFGTRVSIYHVGQLSDGETLICFFLETKGVTARGLSVDVTIHAVERGTLRCSMTLTELLKNEH